MKTILITASLLNVLLFVGCRESRNNLVQPSVPAGAFQFTGYDRTGNIVDTGWLLINIENPNSVSGTWQLSTQESGELRGSVSNGRVVIDLHPDMVDNNFILSGSLEGKTYSGEWEKIGIAGVIASGTFVAQQR
jgi:hypothetical protein